MAEDQPTLPIPAIDPKPISEEPDPDLVFCRRCWKYESRYAAEHRLFYNGRCAWCGGTLVGPPRAR